MSNNQPQPEPMAQRPQFVDPMPDLPQLIIVPSPNVVQLQPAPSSLIPNRRAAARRRRERQRMQHQIPDEQQAGNDADDESNVSTEE